MEELRQRFELPEVVPVLAVFGQCGNVLVIKNSSHNYTHQLQLRNLAPALPELPVFNYLEYFPGPLDDTTPEGPLHKYCLERGKRIPEWKLMAQLMRSGPVLRLPEDPAEAIRLKAVRQSVADMFAWSDTEEPVGLKASEMSMEDTLDLLRKGQFEDTVSKAMVRGHWAEAFFAASMSKHPDQLRKVMAEFSRKRFGCGSELYTLSLLKLGNLGELLTREGEVREHWSSHMKVLLNSLEHLDVSTARKFVSGLQASLDRAGLTRPANLCALIADHAPSIKHHSLMDSLQLCETFAYSREEKFPARLSLIYAKLLAEVGLVDRARDYLSCLDLRELEPEVEVEARDMRRELAGIRTRKKKPVGAFN
jgi:hypothetical protein